MSFRKNMIVAVALAAFGVGGIAAADASPWGYHRPRRVEVNHRLAHQDYRIDRALREGRITLRQAANLHYRDRMIRYHERVDAYHHGGHLTLAEQAALNRHENRVSRQIYRSAH